MPDQRTAVGGAATEVFLSIFRANGRLLAAGDLISAEEGLTSARWQVLGAIALEQRPLTVPQIARRMGLTRQSVHSTVRRLGDDGLLERVPNADHRRSQLVRLTESGSAAYAAIDARQAVWANRIADGIACDDLGTAACVLEELSRRLEADDDEAATRRNGGDG